MIHVAWIDLVGLGLYKFSYVIYNCCGKFKCVYKEDREVDRARGGEGRRKGQDCKELDPECTMLLYRQLRERKLGIYLHPIHPSLPHDRKYCNSMPRKRTPISQRPSISPKDFYIHPFTIPYHLSCTHLTRQPVPPSLSKTVEAT